MTPEDLKVVLYKDNAYPKTMTLNLKKINRLFFMTVIFAVLIFSALGLLSRKFFSYRISGQNLNTTLTSINETYGPMNSTGEMVEKLKDENDQLENKIKTLTTQLEMKYDTLDTKHPILSLFSPMTTDQTKGQAQVLVKNFTYNPSKGRDPTTLSFELHNAEPGSVIQKGYIVVLAKTGGIMKAYPNVFSTKSPFLVDFEKGESFQVSRFRMVNAQFEPFDQKDGLPRFHVLIFKRTGELLFNALTEVQNGQ